MKSSLNTALAVALAMPMFAFAQAPASGLRYPSAFADYKPYREVQAGNWRALNDAVRDVGGGSMAHEMAKQPSASASASASATPKATPKTPMEAHTGHQMPGGMK
jgi:hypothetical protein